MPASTTKILRVMQTIQPGTKAVDTMVEPASSVEMEGATIDKTMTEITEKQPQLTPSPSMGEVMGYYLNSSKQKDNTPLR